MAVFFSSPFFFNPQKSRIHGLFSWVVSRQCTKRVDHFYPGDSGHFSQTWIPFVHKIPALFHYLLLVTKCFQQFFSWGCRMREPKAESGLHNFGPGNTETCFSWPWTRPKFSIQLLFQVWSMQRLVSVFHIMSVRVVRSICLRRHFTAWYGGVTSRQHISQGCPLSSFLFSIILALLIEYANAALLSRKDLARVSDRNLLCPKAAHGRHKRGKKGQLTVHEKKLSPKCRSSGSNATIDKPWDQCLRIASISRNQRPFPQTFIPEALPFCSNSGEPIIHAPSLFNALHVKFSILIVDQKNANFVYTRHKLNPAVPCTQVVGWR